MRDARECAHLTGWNRARCRRSSAPIGCCSCRSATWSRGARGGGRSGASRRRRCRAAGCSSSSSRAPAAAAAAGAGAALWRSSSAATSQPARTTDTHTQIIIRMLINALGSINNRSAVYKVIRLLCIKERFARVRFSPGCKSSREGHRKRVPDLMTGSARKQMRTLKGGRDGCRRWRANKGRRKRRGMFGALLSRRKNSGRNSRVAPWRSDAGRVPTSGAAGRTRRRCGTLRRNRPPTC